MTEENASEIIHGHRPFKVLDANTYYLAKLDELEKKIDRILAFCDKLEAVAEEMSKNPLLQRFLPKVN